MKRAALAFVLTMPLFGCGSAPQSKPVTVIEPSVREDLPTWCTGGNDPCRPTRDFAKRLCAGHFPGAALYLFQKSSPWQHRWVKAKGLDGQNGEGGPSGGELQFAEEVLVMAHDVPATEGVGAKNKTKGKQPEASLVVLRWDGTCSSIQASKAVTYQPGAQKNALVDYTKLDPAVQRSLLRDPDFEKSVTVWQKACEGGASSECEKSHQALSTLMVNKIRRGTKLGMPEERP